MRSIGGYQLLFAFEGLKHKINSECFPREYISDLASIPFHQSASEQLQRTEWALSTDGSNWFETSTTYSRVDTCITMNHFASWRTSCSSFPYIQKGLL